MTAFGGEAMNFDFPAFAGAVRTASALLIGNSVLVYMGVLVLLLACVTRSNK
jgi:hypothetical protein